MIIRIVKMNFREEEVDSFLQLFHNVKHKIRQFPGCQKLELLQDINKSNTLFTYSYWDSEDALNLYRNSELFAETWKNTKKGFSEKAEAWSVEQLVVLNDNILN